MGVGSADEMGKGSRESRRNKPGRNSYLSGCNKRRTGETREIGESRPATRRIFRLQEQAGVNLRRLEDGPYLSFYRAPAFR